MMLSPRFSLRESEAIRRANLRPVPPALTVLAATALAAMVFISAPTGTARAGDDEQTPPPAVTAAEAQQQESTPATEKANPIVLMETSLGSIKLELWPEKAPVTGANFLAYVGDGFYDGLVFHRIIPHFMIQGGGYHPDMTAKHIGTRKAIRNEANNGLSNTRGTIAMARTSDPHSATCQFFINVVDNSRSLDYHARSPTDWGYCVFGHVIEGMDVVDRIKDVKTKVMGQHRDAPAEPVVINSMKILVPGAEAEPDSSKGGPGEAGSGESGSAKEGGKESGK